MALAALRKQGPPRDARSWCGISKWLETLSPADRAEAVAMIDDDEWPTATLHRALRADPDAQYPLQSEKPLATHRNGACHCAR